MLSFLVWVLCNVRGETEDGKADYEGPQGPLPPDENCHFEESWGGPDLQSLHAYTVSMRRRLKSSWGHSDMGLLAVNAAMSPKWFDLFDVNCFNGAMVQAHMFWSRYGETRRLTAQRVLQLPGRSPTGLPWGGLSSA